MSWLLPPLPPNFNAAIRDVNAERPESRVAAAERLGQLRVAVAEVVHQPAIAAGLLDRVQVRPLDVLDDADLQHLDVVELAHDDRHRMQADALGRAPAPLAGDDLVLAGRAGSGADQDGLDNALDPDRFFQVAELGFVEHLARLVGVATQQFDGRRPGAFAADRRVDGFSKGMRQRTKVAAARAQGEAATVNLVFQAGVTTFGPVKIGPAPKVG